MSMLSPSTHKRLIVGIFFLFAAIAATELAQISSADNEMERGRVLVTTPNVDSPTIFSDETRSRTTILSPAGVGLFPPASAQSEPDLAIFIPAINKDRDGLDR